MTFRKLLIVPALAFATSLPLAAQVIDFTTSNGFSIGSLNGQQNWLAESSWTVDPSGSGTATTTTANEIPVLDNPITLTSGQSYSFSVNFQFQGTLTQPTAGQFTYAILTGLTGINTATERGLNTEAADVNIQIIGNNNNYRLLNAFGTILGTSVINGATPLNEGDVLQLDYTLTLGADATSTIYTVRLQNLTDSTDTGTGTVTGIDPSLYTALTGTGAYYFFEADGFAGDPAFVREFGIREVSRRDPVAIAGPHTGLKRIDQFFVEHHAGMTACQLRFRHHDAQAKTGRTAAIAHRLAHIDIFNPANRAIATDKAVAECAR